MSEKREATSETESLIAPVSPSSSADKPAGGHRSSLFVPLSLTMFILGSGVLHALTIEPRNVSDNAPSSMMDFGSMHPRKQHAESKQYMTVSYPTDMAEREIRIYSNNSGWMGAPSNRSGLISTHSWTRIPLYWSEYSQVQDKGIVFSSQSETNWKSLVDINDADFEAKRSSTVIRQNETGLSIIYLKTAIPSGIPSGQYRTRIVVEIINKVSDTGAPKLVSSSYQSITFSKKPVRFLVTIDEDVQVKSAVFYYRFKGDPNYASQALALSENPDNPFQWIGSAIVPPDALRAGTLQYYFAASDGNSTSFSGTESAPHETEFVPEYVGIEASVSASGGKVSIFEGDPRYGSSELQIPAGSIDKEIIITARKLEPGAYSNQGQAPLVVCEFRPNQPVKFIQPIQLSLKYDDENEDGIVDGTNISVNSLAIFWWDHTEWRYVGGKAQPSQHTVNVPLGHLSVFGLFPASLGEGNFRPKEKIITPALRDGFNDFAVFDGLEGLGESFIINLFDIAGRKVRTLSQVGQWDGYDSDGKIVESGVYIYQVHVQGRVFSGTITVAK